MQLVDSVSSSVNRGATTIVEAVNKIATNPSAGKKVLQISVKVFAAVDLYYGRGTQRRPITDAMKGTINLIEGYGSFKNMTFWVYLFSKSTIDEKALARSLKTSLTADCQNQKQLGNQEKLAQQVYQQVMSDKAVYHSKGEVRRAIKATLETKKYTSEQAQLIADQVIVRQKSRPVIQLLTSACFTISDLGGNLLTLKEWGIWDLSQLSAVANRLGAQSPVFAVVVKVGAETSLRLFATAGLSFSFGHAAYRAITNASKWYQAAAAEDKNKARKELRNAMLDLFSSGTDLAATVTPLLFVVSPQTMIILAITAKTTGLICILIR